MSQAGLSRITSGSLPPSVATTYVTNSGNATPAANILNVLGSTVAAGSNPFRSIGSGSTVTYQAQISQAIAATDATKIGLAAFDSSVFSVDANGFVTLGGSTPKAVVLAYLNTGLVNVTGDGTGVKPLIFDTALTNIGAAYNVATGIFTAPAAGNYWVSCNVMFNNLLGTHDEGELIFNKPIGGDFTKIIANPGLNRTQVTGYTAVFSMTLVGIVNLLAAQQFQIGVVVNHGTKTVGIQGLSFGLETSLSISQL